MKAAVVVKMDLNMRPSSESAHTCKYLPHPAFGGIRTHTANLTHGFHLALLFTGFLLRSVLRPCAKFKFLINSEDNLPGFNDS